MTVVAVAGGLGDFGRLIADALLATSKHEVYLMSRKASKDSTPHRISPLNGESYQPVLRTDYSSEKDLVEQLSRAKVEVIICAFIMDCDSASDAQLSLIRAADRSTCVKRYIPSEFNVEYDVSDEVLPYPEKRYHIIARRELEKTKSLEYTYIYPGMLMDYFGMPRVKSGLRPLCFFVDPINGIAVLPDDGEARMSMAVASDVARLIALALELDQWPRVMTAAVSTVSLNQLVKLVEQSLGRKLQVRYQPVEKLLKHEAIDLPSNVKIAEDWPERFPQGLAQVRGLVADLEAGVALGAFDVHQSNGRLDLVETFKRQVPDLKTIESLVEEAWRKPA